MASRTPRQRQARRAAPGTPDSRAVSGPVGVTVHLRGFAGKVSSEAGKRDSTQSPRGFGGVAPRPQALSSLRKMRPINIEVKGVSGIRCPGLRVTSKWRLCPSFPAWSPVFCSAKREHSCPRGRIVRGKCTEHRPKAGTQRVHGGRELLGSLSHPSCAVTVLMIPNLGLQ